MLAALASGGLIAYPTESVIGLGCDPANEVAVRRLLAMKQRPEHKGLILVAANQQQVAPWVAGLSREQREQLDASWPGPVTWLLPDDKHRVPTWIKGAHSRVAIRVSAHPVVQALCLAWGGPLVSTSANVAGWPPARSILGFQHHLFRTRLPVDYVVPGFTQGLKNPTEIRDLISGKRIRTG